MLSVPIAASREFSCFRILEHRGQAAPRRQIDVNLLRILPIGGNLQNGGPLSPRCVISIFPETAARKRMRHISGNTGQFAIAGAIARLHSRGTSPATARPHSIQIAAPDRSRTSRADLRNGESAWPQRARRRGTRCPASHYEFRSPADLLNLRVQEKCHARRTAFFFQHLQSVALIRRRRVARASSRGIECGLFDQRNKVGRE